MENRFDRITADSFVRVYQESVSIDDMCEKLNLPKNGTSQREVNRLLKLYGLDKSVFREKRYELTHRTMICPVCGKIFVVRKGDKKVTCSYSCSNKYFRSGENNGQRKKTLCRVKKAEEIHSSTYHRLCFTHHKHECIICGENRIVSVHHFNGNHLDNSVENLVPLCPTHHQYIHSKYKSLIIDRVKEYVEDFKKQFLTGGVLVSTGIRNTRCNPTTEHQSLK